MTNKTSKRGASRKTRKKGLSKKLITTLSVLLMMVSITALVYINRDKFVIDGYPIKSVRVESELINVSDDELRSAVAAYAEGGFFKVNVEEIRKELEALEWVDVAVVRRQWPDKVVVRLVEHKPVAFWGEQGMVNENGVVFNPELTTSSYSHLPVLNGPDGSSKQMINNYYTMNEQATAIGQQISELEMSKRKAWKMSLSNGLKVELGREDVTKRFSRLKDAYALTIGQFVDSIELVDLRYTNGFAIRWREGAQPVING